MLLKIKMTVTDLFSSEDNFVSRVDAYISYPTVSGKSRERKFFTI